MWCTAAANNKTVYRERYKDPLTGKTKVATVTLAGSDSPKLRKLAFEALNNKIASVSDRVECPRLKDLYDSYINYQTITNRSSTVKRNKSTLKKCVDLIGEDALLDKLTASRIRESLISYTQNPITLNEYVKRLKAMLTYGYDNDMVKDPAVFAKLKMFKVDKQADDFIKPEDKYLESDELAAVLAYMQNSQTQWYLLTRFLVLSGLRIGEAMALTVSDLGESITVNKTYSLTTGEIHPPKTGCSIREVYIQPELAEAIKEIRQYHRNMDILEGCRSKLLFHNEKGGYISYGAYNKYVREVTERVIGSRRKPHAFRHTHASLLFGEGVAIDTISRRLGHENSAITRKIYLHIVEKIREHDKEILSDKRILA